MKNKRGVIVGLIVLTLVGLAEVASHYGEWGWIRNAGETWRGRETSNEASSQFKPTGGRLALVIGNEAYTGESILSNPVNDAVAMGDLFKRAGFEVLTARNTRRQELENAIADFLRHLRASGGSTGLFYYSGHGMQVGGKNYLIPVDAQIRDEHDVPGQAVALERVLDGMDQRGGGTTNLVILDACRNNPFQGVRGGRRGLVQEKVPDSTLILYAAKPGMVASDNRQGRNGLFTHYLVEALSQPGVKVRDALDQVAREVYQASSEKQLPWLEGVLLTPLVLIPAEATPPSGDRGVVESASNAAVLELEFWKSSTACGTQACYQAYLNKYPRGEFAALARIRSKEKEMQPIPNKKKPEMIRISERCFPINSSELEKDLQKDKQHEICIAPFELGKNKVTVEDFQQFVSATGYRTDAEQNMTEKGCFALSEKGELNWQESYNWRKPGYSQSDYYPVVCVSWNDAIAYTVWLNKETGQNYRLPTESEWQAHGFQPNDMLGNVWEWTCSSYSKNDNLENNCTNKDMDNLRTLRGGSWYYSQTGVHLTHRFGNTPIYRSIIIGFRLARSL